MAGQVGLSFAYMISENDICSLWWISGETHLETQWSESKTISGKSQALLKGANFILNRKVYSNDHERRAILSEKYQHIIGSVCEW